MVTRKILLICIRISIRQIHKSFKAAKGFSWNPVAPSPLLVPHLASTWLTHSNNTSSWKELVFLKTWTANTTNNTKLCIYPRALSINLEFIWIPLDKAQNIHHPVIWSACAIRVSDSVCTKALLHSGHPYTSNNNGKLVCNSHRALNKTQEYHCSIRCNTNPQDLEHHLTPY